MTNRADHDPSRSPEGARPSQDELSATDRMHGKGNARDSQGGDAAPQADGAAKSQPNASPSLASQADRFKKESVGESDVERRSEPRGKSKKTKKK